MRALAILGALVLAFGAGRLVEQGSREALLRETEKHLRTCGYAMQACDDLWQDVRDAPACVEALEIEP